MRVIVESPLKGATPAEFQRNFRYLLWCCRAEYEAGNEPIASRLICPWFMDDQHSQERQDGINWSWLWDGNARDTRRIFYTDLGESSGMKAAIKRCGELMIVWDRKSLKETRPYLWEAFQRGEWPPHTPGFELDKLYSPTREAAQ